MTISSSNTSRTIEPPSSETAFHFLLDYHIALMTLLNSINFEFVSDRIDFSLINSRIKK